MYIFKIPLAQTLATDDLGWLLGEDESKTGGPHRLHSNHKITFEDYEKYINLAKSLGTRFMGAFVLSEFDRENICAKDKYNKPIAPLNITEKGLDWTNDLSDSKIMEYIKENGAYIDFALHGVRHGHYENGINYGGEWGKRPLRDDDDNLLEGEATEVTPWDSENKTNYVIADCFKELLRQYFTEDELDFPESFIPPQHILYVNPKDENSTCGILSKYGVKYSTLRYTSKKEIMPYFTKFGLFDHGVFMVDRRAPKEVSFDKDSCKPLLLPRPYPFIETHFNNLWGIENIWKRFLETVNMFPTRMLAKNTENVFSQYVYRKFVKIQNGYIDFTSVPKEFYDKNIVSNIVLKIFLGPFEISEVNSELSPCGYYKDKYGYGYLTLADINNPMGRCEGKYKFSFKIGIKPLGNIADNSMDTYCLYGREENSDTLKFRLKVYRKQTLIIKTKKKITNITSSNEKVKMDNFSFGKDYVKIDLNAVSMKGNETIITLEN